MAQAAFAVEGMDNTGERLSPVCPISVSIFADRAHLRAQMREDALGAGLRVARCAPVAELLDGDALPMGDLLLLDCPQVDGCTLAALARLDMRVARCAAQLVVSTSVEALDDVFGCLDQSGAQLLVNPTAAERLVALGHALGRASGQSVRELSEEDRMTLLRLTEQVDRIARRIDGAGLSGMVKGDALKGANDPHGASARSHGARPSLPDPRLVRRIIAQRQLRARYFDGELFADPAWDMLLDLAAARAEHTRVSVSSLCIASGVPHTTALRWIGQMTEIGLFVRLEDEVDRRRAFIALSDMAADGMARYFAELGDDALLAA